MSGPRNPKQAAYIREYRRRKYESAKGYVYALFDPRTKIVRYIGSTWDYKRRHTQHKNPIYCSYGPRDKWFQELWDEGLNPEMVLLEVCERDEREEREQYWIDVFKATGTDLLIGHEPKDHNRNYRK